MPPQAIRDWQTGGNRQTIGLTRFVSAVANLHKKYRLARAGILYLSVGAGYQPARYAAMIVEGFRAGYYPAPYGFNGGNTIILHFGENQILDR